MHTGTNKKSHLDNNLLSDAAVALGLQKHDNRFKNARKLTKQVKKKYDTKQTTQLGHSLGSGLARHGAGKKDKVIGFNGAFGLGDVGKKHNKNETNIRVSGDVLSSLSLTKPKKGSKSKTIRNLDPTTAHDLDNLDNVEKRVF